MNIGRLIKVQRPAEWLDYDLMIVTYLPPSYPVERHLLRWSNIKHIKQYEFMKDQVADNGMHTLVSERWLRKGDTQPKGHWNDIR